MTKTFQKINESFDCVVCGHRNTPAPKTCRNHCQKCLCSLHVDITPGDRAETCHGILCPVGIETVGGQMSSILFRCEKCGKTSKNKIADDDDREKLLEVFSRKN